MTGHLVIHPEGIEIRGIFRKRFVPWNDVAGFFLREGSFRSTTPSGGLMFETPDTGWVTVRGGDQYQLRGIKTDEQILELNRLLEERRRWLGRSPK